MASSVLKGWDPKDPDDVDAFSFEWADRLTSETITSSIFIIDPDDGTSPLTEDSKSFTTTRTTIWLSGGDEGTDYEITNRITTTASRTLDQTARLRVRSQ